MLCTPCPIPPCSHDMAILVVLLVIVKCFTKAHMIKEYSGDDRFILCRISNVMRDEETHI